MTERKPEHLERGYLVCTRYKHLAASSNNDRDQETAEGYHFSSPVYQIKYNIR